MFDEQKIRDAALHLITEIIDKPKWKHQGDERQQRVTPLPVGAFKRLEPLGFGLTDDDDWVFHYKDFLPQTLWPLNVGYISDRREIARGDSEQSEMNISIVRTIKLHEARGLADRFAREMVRVDLGLVFDGSLATHSMILAWLGGRWVPTIAGSNTDEEIERLPSLAQSIALRQRYEWAVGVGLVGCPSIRFATDPTGMKELFAIRDLPEGKDRRAPLMNWVSDHWRRKRNDPELETYVRRNLRGSATFSWRGLDVEIMPAQFDLDELEKEKARRQRMRADGTDTRMVSK